MKLFIKKIFLFLLPIFILIQGMDFWLRNINTSYKEKIKGLKIYKDSIEVLILGNSQATYGIDPNQFSLYAYNIANVNQSIYFDKRLALKLIPYTPNLKYVFISVDYHSLYFSSQGTQDIWSYYGHGIKYKNKNYILPIISPFFFGYTPKVSLSLLKKRVFKLWEHGNEKIIDFEIEMGVNIKDDFKQGFVPLIGANKSGFTVKSFKSKANSFANLIKTSNENKDVKYDLIEFIIFLKNKGITPILISSPTYNKYNFFLDKDVIFRNQNNIDFIASNYNIKYFNFSDNNLFKKDDFFDCNHLNKNGAKKFSKILNKIILLNESEKLEID